MKKFYFLALLVALAIGCTNTASEIKQEQKPVVVTPQPVSEFMLPGPVPIRVKVFTAGGLSSKEIVAFVSGSEKTFPFKETLEEIVKCGECMGKLPDSGYLIGINQKDSLPVLWLGIRTIDYDPFEGGKWGSDCYFFYLERL